MEHDNAYSSKSWEEKYMQRDEDMSIISKVGIYQNGLSYAMSIRVSYQSLLTALETLLFGFVITLTQLGLTESNWIFAVLGLLLCIGFGSACEWRARNVDFWRKRIVEVVKGTDLEDDFRGAKYEVIPFGRVGRFGERIGLRHLGHWYEKIIIPAMMLIWFWILTW